MRSIIVMHKILNGQVDREPAPREKGERRRERDRERQRERDRERRLRREKERQEREKGRGSDEQQVEDKSGGSKPSTDKEKDLKAKGKITYSRTGNVTRWSENSGPRKVLTKLKPTKGMLFGIK